MPHFENLEKYEGKNPRSGKREIVPIAPHSTQASDYRPRKGQSSKRIKREGLPEFKNIEIEPISVQQMEKEFKAAGRKQKKSRRRGQRKSLWKRLKAFLVSLFGTKKANTKGRNRNRNRRRGGPNRARGNKADQQRNQQGQGGNRNQRRSGKNRSRGNNAQGQGKSQGQGKAQGQGKPQGQKGAQGNRKPQKSTQQKNPQQENRTKAGDRDQPNRRRRNRRNRNRSRNPGQKGDSGNSASQ